MPPFLCSTVTPCLLIFARDSQRLSVFIYACITVPAALTMYYWKEKTARLVKNTSAEYVSGKTCILKLSHSQAVGKTNDAYSEPETVTFEG